MAGLATALWEATLGELEQRLDAGRAALERGEVWTFEEVRLPGVPLEPELAPRARAVLEESRRLEGRVEMRMGEVVSQLLAESAARPGPAHSAGAGAERPTPAFVDRLA